MEKNVGSVDLEELMKAREALNEERGIQTDPTMYDNYNPNREAEENSSANEDVSSESESYENSQEQNFQPAQENGDSGNQTTSEENSGFSGFDDLINSALKDSGLMSSDSNAENNTEDLSNENLQSNEPAQEPNLENYKEPEEVKSNETSSEENNQEKDFDAYDKFSAFEINPQTTSVVEPSKEDDVSLENNATNISEKLESEQSAQENEELENSGAEENEISIETDENAQEEVSNDSENLQNSDENANDLSAIGTIDFDSIINENLKSNESVEDNENEKSEESLESETKEPEESEEQPEEALEQTKDTQNQTEEVKDESEQENTNSENAEVLENQVTPNAQDNQTVADYNTEVIDDYTKLKNLDNLLDEEDQESQEEPVIEKPKIEYPDIEPVEFVDLIATDEFKNSDKLSYILGKDENDKVYYGNLRDFYNIAIFGKESNSVIGLAHSIILSLMLKNGVSEFNLVVCDSKADSKFEVYNKSTYMYFNRIAKTNKEILDTLIELTKELEERYKILAETGVKSIEQYNIIAKNDNLKPLPYIVTVFNNYSKSVQLTESDKINTCLYQLLKFGRSVGMYEIVVAGGSIVSDEINYNLPTRMAFLTDDEDVSLRTLGETGAEQLPTSSDFLLSSIEKRNIIHLRVPNITKSEIEVLIDSINE